MVEARTLDQFNPTVLPHNLGGRVASPYRGGHALPPPSLSRISIGDTTHRVVRVKGEARVEVGLNHLNEEPLSKVVLPLSKRFELLDRALPSSIPTLCIDTHRWMGGTRSPHPSTTLCIVLVWMREGEGARARTPRPFVAPGLRSHSPRHQHTRPTVVTH